MIKGIINKILVRIYRKAKHLDQQLTYDSFRKKYDLDPEFRFNGASILMYGNGKIIAGKNSYVGEYSTWQAGDGCEIRIGSNCRISHNVRCYTSTKQADSDFSLENIPSKHASVIIEDNVWIGANVFINPGVTIGNNSIIGANSVVNNDVPAKAIVGGVPATVIRSKKL